MKPIVLFLCLAIVVVIVQVGNGCSTSFKTKSELNMLTAASCQNDESRFVNLLSNWKVGYLGTKKVAYTNLGNGWLLLDSDKLYRSSSDLPQVVDPNFVQRGVGVTSVNTWPGGNVPYVIDAAMPAANQSLVADAVNHWNNNLSGVLYLHPRTNESDYVMINWVTSGCFSQVGYYQGSGPHPMNISADCGSGNIAHEFGHIVGLDHEQNRLDRDSYIAINFSKIQSTYATNFDITNGHQDYLSYDFGSIMHYGLNAFSTDGSNTMTPLVSVPAGTVVGQRQGLSNGDINSVRSMYGATTSAPTTTPTSTGSSNGQGLYGHFYDGVDFVTLKTEQLNSDIDFNWGSQSPANGVGSNYFSIEWDGWVTPNAAGDYVFDIAGQDGLQVSLNGNVILNNLSNSGPLELASQSISLNAGQSYPIQVRYVSREANANVHLKWEMNGGATTVIPSANLTPKLQSYMSGVCGQ